MNKFINTDLQTGLFSINTLSGAIYQRGMYLLQGGSKDINEDKEILEKAKQQVQELKVYLDKVSKEFDAFTFDETPEN